MLSSGSSAAAAHKMSQIVSSSESDILCFEHCDCKIFALDLPESCPVFSTHLIDCDFRMPPFKLPSPFSRAQDYPCSVIIKPTKGSFLNDYQNGNNLHIAITNSKGFVVEYDQGGVHREKTLDWNRCLVINLLSSEHADPDIVLDPDWGEYWDWCVESTINSRAWTKDGYNEDEHNCFTFVLSFLRSLKQNPFSAWAENKVDFCQHYILPKTRLASKYICLYRKLKESEGILSMKKISSHPPRSSSSRKAKSSPAPPSSLSSSSSSSPGVSSSSPSSSGTDSRGSRSREGEERQQQQIKQDLEATAEKNAKTKEISKQGEEKVLDEEDDNDSSIIEDF